MAMMLQLLVESLHLNQPYNDYRPSAWKRYKRECETEFWNASS